MNSSYDNGSSYPYMNVYVEGAQDGYQVNFTIPWETGMNSDFSNIRFFAVIQTQI